MVTSTVYVMICAPNPTSIAGNYAVHLPAWLLYSHNV